MTESTHLQVANDMMLDMCLVLFDKLITMSDNEDFRFVKQFLTEQEKIHILYKGYFVDWKYSSVIFITVFKDMHVSVTAMNRFEHPTHEIISLPGKHTVEMDIYKFYTWFFEDL